MRWPRLAEGKILYLAEVPDQAFTRGEIEPRPTVCIGRTRLTW